MTHLEKIRGMSAEELANWLIEDVEQSQDFSTSFCDPKYCPRMLEIVMAEARGERFEDVPCPEDDCLSAAVAYLNSEVEE